MTEEPYARGRRSWPKKFRDAFRGMREGIRDQSSFFVHFFCAAVVLVSAALLHLNHWDWCILVLCIAGVLTAEMFNSALESLARAITDRHDPHLRSALDIGSAAVLLAALGAAVVGAIIFVHRAGTLLAWW
jgi:diacylglycerol kinase